METDQNRKTSAAMFFDLPQIRATLFIRAFGDMERMRKVLSAACSHRRSIVTTNGAAFVSNVIAGFVKQGTDNVELSTEDCVEAYRVMHQAYEWNYRITLKGKALTPWIQFHSSGKDMTNSPIYQFLRTRFMREWVLTPARKKNPGGRPKERWLRDDLWKKMNLSEPVRARYARISQQRRDRAEEDRKLAAGIPLDLKDIPKKSHKKHRIVSVDFSGTVEDLRTLSKHDQRELDPEYEHELDQLYGTEAGAQP